MRVITHTDLDGVFSAVLLNEVEEVYDIKFLDPNTIQNKKIEITKEDIIADLPYDKRCGMWFDHHESSKPENQNFKGSWKLAPSAARVIYDYYENPYLEKYSKILLEVDRIDSGKITKEDIQNPQGWFLISNTFDLSSKKAQDDEYRLYIVDLIQKTQDISQILKDKIVNDRILIFQEQTEYLKKIIKEKTKIIGNVAFLDLREFEKLPKSPNYLMYSIFPDVLASVRLMPAEKESENIKLSVGINVFKEEIIDKNEINIGLIMKEFGGGGHKGVGGATIKREKSEEIADYLINELNKKLKN